MTSLTKALGKGESGASLLEILIAVALLGVIVPLTSMHLLQSVTFRKAKLDRSTAVAMADGAVAQAAYSLRESIRGALDQEIAGIRAQIFHDTVENALSGKTPGGALLLSKASALALPPSGTLRRDAYSKTLRRCQGKTPGRHASPWLAYDAAYICFYLDKTSDTPTGLWNSVDSAYPVLIELTMRPVDPTGKAFPFDALPGVAQTSQIRLFYSVVWVDRQGKSLARSVHSTAKEQYVPVL
jgi:hypothetical protein